MDAHRLILHAADHSRQWETADALFEAYFAEGANLNDHDELAEVAAKTGLDADATRSFLSGGGRTEEVWRSQEEAGRIGVSGVPFYVFDGRHGLSGAQPVEMFVRALDAVHGKTVV